MELREKEKAKYEKVWKEQAYHSRSPANRIRTVIWKELELADGDRVIDLGCGTGRVATHFARKGVLMTCLDIADNTCQEFDGPFIEACLWELPDIHFEKGYCVDVLEHIPTDKVDEVIENIARVCDKVFFQIANFPHVFAGETLHLTVRPAPFWEEKLKKCFKSVKITPGDRHNATCEN